MTPVEATMMSSPFIPSSAASAAQVFSAFAYPSGVQALAFPLLQIAARATPFVRCALVTPTGAAKTRFCVKTPAAAQSFSATLSARSS